MTALLRGAVSGSATGLLGTLATLRLHDIRTGDEASVLLFGLAAGLGAGAALGAGCESPSRRARFGAGIAAALLGFVLFAGAVLLAAGKL
ncbi:MAG TPA: hypothetical protein VFF73_18965, partial [Planctomycetota bacterium]|nr:hypothetical protein [Planctomycetota bacterium]